MLADAGLNGATEALLRTLGFTAMTIAGLVRAGLATVTTERMRAGGKMIVVAKLRIQKPAGSRCGPLQVANYQPPENFRRS